MLALPVGGCGIHDKIDPGDKETFIAVYTELTLAKAHYAGVPGKFVRFKEIILRKHGVDEKFLTDFLAGIDSHPEIELEVFQAIADRLKQYDKLPPDSLNRLIFNFENEP